MLQECIAKRFVTTDHPVGAASEAVFFLMAQPPLLFQEGNTPPQGFRLLIQKPEFKLSYYLQTLREGHTYPGRPPF
jgi:hypothetical protein